MEPHTKVITMDSRIVAAAAAIALLIAIVTVVWVRSRNRLVLTTFHIDVLVCAANHDDQLRRLRDPSWRATIDELDDHGLVELQWRDGKAWWISLTTDGYDFLADHDLI